MKKKIIDSIFTLLGFAAQTESQTQEKIRIAQFYGALLIALTTPRWENINK